MFQSRLVFGCVSLLGLSLAGAAAQLPQERVVEDRKDFIPNRKNQIIAGKTIGVLVSETAPVLATEGRSGPPDMLCFSQNGCSYRWFYVPAAGAAEFPQLRMALANGQERP